MDEQDGPAIRFALLLAAYDGWDLAGRGTETSARRNLVTAGLLDEQYRITEIGRMVAEDALDAAKRAEVWYAAKQSDDK